MLFDKFGDRDFDLTQIYSFVVIKMQSVSNFLLLIVEFDAIGNQIFKLLEDRAKELHDFFLLSHSRNGNLNNPLL